jgi:UDP-N-acetylglucosamine--N-acetylmuramyl-(pentapeptide) pyrophosphoryl-undecaprenol N-acetylglucosamine transferase
VSLPVGLAARLSGYPYVIHESDSIMGMSNKMLAKHAAKICVSYPEKNYKELDPEKLVYTGNPVREDIFEGKKQAALDKFLLHGNRPVIMIIGGSQGSHIINEMIAGSFKELLEKYELIHVSGERDYDWLSYEAQKLDDELKKYYHLYNFLSGNLADAYAASDLIISRAGNAVISEIAALGKPSILIPISFSANNHQLENARIISRSGGALLMLQEHLSSQKLLRQINLLFEEPKELENISEKIRQFAQKDAAKLVAEEILKEGEEYIEEGEDEDSEGQT